jgi:hypothetical protein
MMEQFMAVGLECKDETKTVNEGNEFRLNQAEV